MKHGFNDDKTIAPFGIKAITTYDSEIEIPEAGSYYKLFTTPDAHTLEKCVVQMEIAELNDIPFSQDNYYHILGCGIIRVNQVSPTLGDGISVRYFVSDSGTDSAQFPLTVTVRIKVTEFY